MKNLFRLLTTGYKIIIQMSEAVTEGLRIWTSRPYFKENPYEAVGRIATLKKIPVNMLENQLEML